MMATGSTAPKGVVAPQGAPEVACPLDKPAPRLLWQGAKSVRFRSPLEAGPEGAAARPARISS